VTANRRLSCCVVLAAALFANAHTAAAQSPPPPPHATIEIGYGASRLTSGYASWTDMYARGSYSRVDNVWRGELARRSAFGDSGLFFGAGLTRTLTRRWYASVGAGTSAGGFFFPRAYAGVGVARKWLDRQRLVTTTALNVYDQKDDHRDLLWSSSGIYYFVHPAIVEAGIIVSRSSPGGIVSSTPFVAATLGRPQQRTLSVRFASGREAYQRIDLNRALIAFPSHVMSAEWREVIVTDAGLALRVERYGNPLYNRTGLALSGFLGTGILGRTPDRTR
jgi:YaiO family outer membrane protein